MSRWGTRTTPLLNISVEQVVDWADDNPPGKHFNVHIKFFFRIWKWEFTATLFPDTKQRLRYVKNWGAGIPGIGWLEWGYDEYPIHQTSTDWDDYIEEEYLASKRKAVQTPE